MTESISQVHASLAPKICLICDGQGYLLFAEGRVSGPCPSCRDTTETDDERAAWIADDAAMERRSDR